MNKDRYYKPELDILRLVAFLFVFFTHRMDLAPIDAATNYWGYHISLVGVFGVPLFFFLSAFLITELLTKEQDQFGTINIKSFYIRRILRIWPLYFAFFFGIVFITHISKNFGFVTTNNLLAYCFFYGNWYITFHQWLSSYPLNPLWSISVEEQFYLLLPLILYYFGKKGLKIFSVLSFIAAYFTIVYYALHPTKGFSGEWTNSFVQFQFFGAGILVSIFCKGWQPNWNGLARVGVFMAGLACWLIASIFCKINADAPHLSTIPQAIGGWLLVLVGVLLFFLSLYGASMKNMPKFLLYLGRISFGMYIFHITTYWIIYYIYKKELAAFSSSIGLYEWRNLLGFVLAFIATVSIASLSYHFFETPFLRLKKKFTLIRSRD